MNTQDENMEVVHASFDSFPEPQTIPAGWDTSGFFSVPGPASAQEADDSAES